MTGLKPLSLRQAAAAVDALREARSPAVTIRVNWDDPPPDDQGDGIRIVWVDGEGTRTPGPVVATPPADPNVRRLIDYREPFKGLYPEADQ